jgi:hypothetical protein
MAVNTLATATLFQKMLDKVAVQEATTGWMDANAGQVIYNGGAEVKIPKMTVQGMGDYDRDNGYQRGSVTLEYETKKMTQDRGRQFQLDSMDINENNFVTTAAAVMGEFQRTQVVPEIDAYRISKLATDTITANKAGMIEYAYVPGTTGTSALRKLKEGIRAVRDGYNGALVCQATSDFILELELEKVLGSTVYRYQLKEHPKNEEGKHIGFVIGDGYALAEDMLDESKSSVDMYSALGIAYKAIQELNAKVNRLEGEIASYRQEAENGKI